MLSAGTRAHADVEKPARRAPFFDVVIATDVPGRTGDGPGFQVDPEIALPELTLNDRALGDRCEDIDTALGQL